MFSATLTMLTVAGVLQFDCGGLFVHIDHATLGYLAPIPGLMKKSREFALEAQ